MEGAIVGLNDGFRVGKCNEIIQLGVNSMTG